MRLLLVGAGGHAHGVVETAELCGHEVVAVADPRPVTLEGVVHVSGDAETLPGDIEGFLLGLGGADPDGLRRRLDLYRAYKARGLAAPSVIHPTAWVSSRANPSDGVIVLANATVQPLASLQDASIVNTGSIVEHESVVGEGAHVAPGACILGGVTVGHTAMVGAGSVVLPGTTIGNDELVPALSRFPIDRKTGSKS